MMRGEYIEAIKKRGNPQCELIRRPRPDPLDYRAENQPVADQTAAMNIPRQRHDIAHPDTAK